jgi:cell wall-associated NlpC family hydrolase
VTLLRRLRPIVLATILVAGPLAMAQAQTPGFSSSEKPFATISRMLLKQPARDSLVDLARSTVGLRYKWGAETPGEAFDCSGLIQWLMGKFDLELPRTSREQVKAGFEVAKDTAEMLPGDLLFFGRGKRITHVGVYVGDGKYVAAASRRKGVVESQLPTGRLATTWWKTVRRLFTHDSATTPRDTTKSQVGAAS